MSLHPVLLCMYYSTAVFLKLFLSKPCRSLDQHRLFSPPLTIALLHVAAGSMRSPCHCHAIIIGNIFAKACRMRYLYFLQSPHCSLRFPSSSSTPIHGILLHQTQNREHAARRHPLPTKWVRMVFTPPMREHKSKTP